MTLQINKIGKKSIFYKYGIRKGDGILSINGIPVSCFESVVNTMSKEKIDIRILRKGGITVEKIIPSSMYENIDIEFLEPNMKVCKNDCLFCFVKHNPKGLRTPLYVKDDDFRLSINYGNFITLNNLTENDIEEIVENKLYPIYVSIHSVNDDMRKKLFGRENPISILNTLLRRGVKVHGQVVLVKGLNDGMHLIDTMEYAHGNNLLSLGIVPCGITKHAVKELKPLEFEYAGKIIASVENWKIKNGFDRIFLADEFYLKADSHIPSAGYYKRFPQIENGIGMCRDFLDSTKRFSKMKLKENHCILTGRLFSLLLSKYDYFKGSPVYAVKNEFFGSTVDVAGLLTGADIIKNLLKIGERNVIMSSLIFNKNTTLDGYDKKYIQNRTDKKIILIKEYVELKEYLND